MSLYQDYLREIAKPFEGIPTFSQFETATKSTIIYFKLTEDIDWASENILEAISETGNAETFAKLFLANDSEGLHDLIHSSVYSHLGNFNNTFNKDIEDALRPIDMSDDYQEPDFAA